MRAPIATIAFVGAMVLLAVPAMAQDETPDTAPDAASATVTYFTSSTVYIDAGGDDGLHPGDRVEVVRDGEVITTLEVHEVSNHRATCKRLDAEVELAIGDHIRFAPGVAEPVAAAAVVATKKTKSRSRSKRGLGIRGRVGVQFLAVQNSENDIANFNQPGVTFWFRGNRIAGTGFGANVDIRARRTTRTTTGETDPIDTQSRVYRLSAGYETRGGVVVSVGRQYSPSLANVSTFDGVAVHYNRPRWSVGGFAGTQPEIMEFEFASDIQEYGAYVQFRGKPETRNRWHLGVGAVGSYENSEVNREFLFLQFRYVSRKLFAYAIQEVDFNRDWKSEVEDQTVQPTSTFLSVRYRISDLFGLVGGFDNRRIVRLWRDRITPETEFDDSFRQGAWLGAEFKPGQKFRFDLAARGNGGGTAGDARTYSGSVGFGPYTRQSLMIRSRATQFTNDNTEGFLGSVFVGMNVTSRIRLGVDAGVRDDRLVQAEDITAALIWYGIQMDVPFGRRWFLLVSLERSDGDFENIDQLYTTVSYRF